MSRAAAWPVDRRITIHDLQAATDRGERWPMLIPTVGIGAGPYCDAQIMVWQDMAGLTAGRLPRFVKRYTDTWSALFDAAHRYVMEIASQHYPDQAHSYT